ncbi:MAG: ComF family protein [Actinobacteria bacterium]|nr:ComF family protein [Actinomycetota bacterium]
MLDPLLATVFPPRCVGCGRFETYLCDECRAALVPVGPEVCRRCGHPGVGSGGPGWCAACVGEEPTYRSARSVFLHEGPARRLVSCFKYDGLRVLGRLLAELAAAEFDALVGEYGAVAITWVPSHASTSRSRGYNQAEVLACCLAQSVGAPPPVRLATKTRRTGHQRGLDREGRSRNLTGAFAPSPDVESSAHVCDALARSEGVVLVDDVFTTGATVAEVTRVITGATGLPVDVFTFGRTPAGFPQRAD